MNKQFALFYHIWAPADGAVWRFMVDEQLKRILRSGLHNSAEIICCISGPHYRAISDFVSGYDWVTVKKATDDQTQFEGLTLEQLYTYCFERPDLCGVGYVHTKGIRFLSSTPSDRNFRAVNSWRHLLEWAVIDRWRDAIVHLGRFDAVGANYRSRPWPHFGGNFWWARPEYIRTLVRPTTGNFPPGDYSWITQEGENRRLATSRLDFERWLGLNNPKTFSFYGYPFISGGNSLPNEFHNLYENDIEPYYRANSV